MRLQLFSLLCLTIFGCSRGNKETVENAGDLQGTQSDSLELYKVDTLDFHKIENYLARTQPDSSKVLRVSGDCAILIYPTDQQVEEMKKEYGEEDFYTIADDATFYQGTAIGILDSLKIQSINATKPYVEFVGQNKTWTFSIRRTGLPEWNLIRFNKEKQPEVVSGIDITADVVKQFYRH